ncbi:sulfocyanin [Stygiolobus caldivivus]|nr:sulfocyanin [Stygiolobus caldivivus]
MKGVSSVFTLIVTVITIAIIVGASVYTFEQYNMYVSMSRVSITSSSSAPKATLPYNPNTKTVYITLVSLSSGSPFNFNGTSFGSMVIYVPAGSNLQITFINQESLPHNLNLVQNTTASPTSNLGDDGKILLTIGASSSDYTVNGIVNGQSATGTFSDIPAGTYWLACGITGHAESGMWVVLIASPNVSTPYVVTS